VEAFTQQAFPPTPRGIAVDASSSLWMNDFVHVGSRHAATDVFRWRYTATAERIF
jgi:hypothetical protein